MTIQIGILLSILLIAVVLMATERLRADVVALLVTIALTLTGLIQPTDTFSGFSRSAVVTIMAIFVLTGGLAHTGVTRMAGRLLLRLSGSSETRLIALTMVGGAGLSLFMNNIAAAAVLLPGVMDAARRSPRNISPSRLLMPLAFATILGGMATLLTTSNILVSTALRDRGLSAFRLTDFAPVGVLIVVVGIVYMLWLGRKLLPKHHPREKLGAAQVRNELTELYALQERLSKVCVRAESPLIGKTIAASGIGEKYGLAVMALVRRTHITRAPQPDEVLRANDLLVVAGRLERVLQLAAEQEVQLESELTWRGDLSSDQVGLVEMLVAPRSGAAGKTLSEIHFREKFGLSAIALWRDGRSIRTDLGKLPLRFGDALLIFGPRDRVRVLQAEQDFLVLEPDDQPVVRPKRAVWAIAIMLIALGLAAANLLPIAEATMAGALAMVLTGCLTMDEAYQSIEWRAIFMIAGMLPVSIAMNRTGAAEYLGQLFVSALVPWGPLAVMAGLFAVTVLLTLVMPGQVTAVVLAPIAISAAQSHAMNPYALALAVALGTSMAFLTPLGHPVNVLVMGSGGYKFSDYFKVGAPLTAVLTLVVLVFLPIFWPLR